MSSLRFAMSRARARLLLAAVAYVAVFQWGYISLVSKWHWYFGMEYHEPPFWLWLLGCTAALTPALWMPLQIRRPTQVTYWILYLTVVIPSSLVPVFTAFRPAPEIAALVLTFLVGFGILATSYLFAPLRLGGPVIPKPIFFSLYFLFSGVLFTWVLISFRGRMELVSFADVYEVLRYAADEVLEGSYVRYASTWLGSALFPALMAYGIAFRRWWWWVAGVAGQLTLYSTAGHKIVALSGVVLLGTYWLLGRDLKKPFGFRTTILITILIALLLSITLLGGEENVLLRAATSLVLTRSIAITGGVTALYHDFFATHPHTYYSHVNLVNLVVTYPYELFVGVELGRYASGDPRLNFNANFWATDGIAALGLPGILLISLFGAALFWFLDSVALRHDLLFSSLLIGYFGLLLANTSVFTTLLTGGLGLVMILMWFAPTMQPARQPERPRRLFWMPFRLVLLKRRAAVSA